MDSCGLIGRFGESYHFRPSGARLVQSSNERYQALNYRYASICRCRTLTLREPSNRVGTGSSCLYAVTQMDRRWSPSVLSGAGVSAGLETGFADFIPQSRPSVLSLSEKQRPAIQGKPAM